MHFHKVLCLNLCSVIPSTLDLSLQSSRNNCDQVNDRKIYDMMKTVVIAVLLVLWCKTLQRCVTFIINGTIVIDR